MSRWKPREGGREAEATPCVSATGGGRLNGGMAGDGRGPAESDLATLAGLPTPGVCLSPRSAVKNRGLEQRVRGVHAPRFQRASSKQASLRLLGRGADPSRFVFINVNGSKRVPKFVFKRFRGLRSAVTPRVGSLILNCSMRRAGWRHHQATDGVVCCSDEAVVTSVVQKITSTASGVAV